MPVSSRGKARRQRVQAQKAAVRRGSRRGVRLVTLLMVGAIVVVIAAAVLLREEGSAAPRPGAVWSAEHGHWH